MRAVGVAAPERGLMDTPAPEPTAASPLPLQALAAIRAWLADNATPITVFFVTRFGLFLVAYLALVMLPLRDAEGLWRTHPDNLMVDGWARWDSGWYGDIARHGYTNTPHGEDGLLGQRDTAFLPGYPLVMAAAALLTGDVMTGGILAANIAFLLALILLYHLVRERYDHDAARRTTILISVFPFAFFFSAAYSESLFLLAAVGMFYMGYHRRWLPAALFCAVGSVTRIQGIMLIPTLAVLYLEMHPFNARTFLSGAAWLAISMVALGLFFAYLQFNFDVTPVGFYELKSAWLNPNFSVNGTVQLFRSLTAKNLFEGTYRANGFLHLLVFFGSMVPVVFWFRRRQYAYGVWGVLSLILSATFWGSAGRFSIVIFPLFLAVALMLRREQVFNAVVYVSTLLLALLTIMFATWYWVS
jgi:hypothetical protein